MYCKRNLQWNGDYFIHVTNVKKDISYVKTRLDAEFVMYFLLVIYILTKSTFNSDIESV